MIARLIDWSARNLMLVLIGAVFAVASGIYALQHSALDAIPDLSDTQVIVYTDYKGQAPQVIEDQVTYPLTTAMLTVPKSKVVRGFSFFGVSFVYIIFEDGTDIYWARSRVLEYLSAAARKLPNGVTPTLGPDATGVGWVYQYALQSKDKNLADLRSLQDWTIRYGIAKAEAAHGIARVLVNCAGIGGSQRIVGKDGVYPLAKFARIINVNLIGTFNVLRLFAERLVTAEPIGEERGVAINTASVAAYEGQIGQIAYSASKGGVVGLTLPAARDLASQKIRVNTIAPGLFLTPLLMGLTEEARKSLGAQVPHPARLGDASEYGNLAVHIVENPMLNGETIRLDGAIRMAPR
ncbi:MAG: efflux RND transporter permease subunit [Bradyrhizobium sp.]|nr:efflux RND transporter permease subunit [Bradyrhizobium sp.]